MRLVLRAGAAALAFTISSVAMAAGYGLSVYNPTEHPRPWTLSTRTVYTDLGRAPTYQGEGSTTVFTVKNSVTGFTQDFGASSYPGRLNPKAQINGRGDLLITYNFFEGGPSEATLWTQQGGRQELGGVEQAGFNTDGDVVGDVYTFDRGYTYRGGLYKDGRWHHVGDPGSPNTSEVSDANSSHWAVGSVKQSEVSGTGTTAIVSSPDRVFTPLPGVAGLGLVYQSSANSINDANVVVGNQTLLGAPTGEVHPIYRYAIYNAGPSFAYIWDGVNGSRDLNTLIDPASALFGKAHLDTGLDIDNQGNIVALGYMLDAPKSWVRFHLSTGVVPEPGTWALMGLGLVGIGALARRSVARRNPGLAAMPG